MIVTRWLEAKHSILRARVDTEMVYGISNMAHGQLFCDLALTQAGL